MHRMPPSSFPVCLTILGLLVDMVLGDLLVEKELGEEGSVLEVDVDDVVDLALMILPFVFSAEIWSLAFLLRFFCSLGEVRASMMMLFTVL